MPRHGHDKRQERYMFTGKRRLKKRNDTNI